MMITIMTMMIMMIMLSPFCTDTKTRKVKIKSGFQKLLLLLLSNKI